LLRGNEFRDAGGDFRNFIGDEARAFWGSATRGGRAIARWPVQARLQPASAVRRALRRPSTGRITSTLLIVTASSISWRAPLIDEPPRGVRRVGRRQIDRRLGEEGTRDFGASFLVLAR
jgi:hypothetical protein